MYIDHKMEFVVYLWLFLLHLSEASDIYTCVGNNVQLSWTLNPIPDPFGIIEVRNSNINSIFYASGTAIASEDPSYTGRIVFNGDTATGQMKFIIKNITEIDAGLYTAVLAGAAGSAIYQGPTLYVFDGPSTVTFTASTNQYIVNELATLPDITCRVNCNPKCEYKWTKDGELSSHGSGYTLSLKNISLNDAGLYRCIGWNRYNTSHSDDIFINVQYLDLSILKSILTYENTQDIELACSPRGNLKDIVFHPWTQKIGSKIIRKLLGSVNGNATSLKVPYSSNQDLGTYTCYAENVYGTLSKSKDMVVTVNDKPVITYTSITQERNRTAKIIVDFYSVPKPLKVEWLKEGSVISLSEKYRQSITVVEVTLTLHDVKVNLYGYRAKLSFTSLTDSDYGAYILKIENEKGIASQKIEFSTEDGYLLIVGLTVGIAIPVLVATAVVTVYLYLRRKQKNQTDQMNEMTHYEDPCNKTNESVYQGISLEGNEDNQDSPINVNEYELVDNTKDVGDYKNTEHKNVSQ